jgi:hypothetical protein
MRYFLFAALLIVVFLRFCDTKQLKHLQIATWEKYNKAHYSGDTHLSLQANDSIIQDLTIKNTDYDTRLKHCAGKKCKIPPHSKAHCKTRSEAAELTLEYFAVQLPRSHAVQ